MEVASVIRNTSCQIRRELYFAKISPLHHKWFYGIMFTSCESGAMAQRGEIRCVERQFVLQSVPAVQAGLANRASQAERERVPSRQEKREKFQTDDTLQRKRSCVCLSSCFRLRQFSRPLLGREEELSVSLNRVWTSRGTQNEDTLNTPRSETKVERMSKMRAGIKEIEAPA